jgi:hypothetical protein
MRPAVSEKWPQNWAHAAKRRCKMARKQSRRCPRRAKMTRKQFSWGKLSGSGQESVEIGPKTAQRQAEAANVGEKWPENS